MAQGVFIYILFNNNINTESLWVGLFVAGLKVNIVIDKGSYQSKPNNIIRRNVLFVFVVEKEDIMAQNHASFVNCFLRMKNVISNMKCLPD